MRLTKRQWIMFSFFIIYFATIMLLFALTGYIEYLLSNIAVILFLAALYLENSPSSSYVVVLSTIMEVVSLFFGIIENPGIMLTFFGILELVKVVAMGYFAYAYFKVGFRRQNVFIPIVVLSGLLGLYYLFTMIQTMMSIYSFNILNITIITLISLKDLALPAAIITFTFFKRKQSNYLDY
ncbi:hypothetical protein JV173_05625 [Acholeplasma equirhinis]|uniref:hypothetical protein n=1 Tax=Acholeplasma equirhinis TaxID=555393 RepID=UPI00197AFAA0|nr:hypothetical protein [Acholeplasma equirhinis]MBN3490993.1 hypothetical protein [Acholeplasma equirhinis]